MEQHNKKTSNLNFSRHFPLKFRIFLAKNAYFFKYNLHYEKIKNFHQILYPWIEKCSGYKK